MTAQRPTSMRLDAALLARADALVPKFARTPALAAFGTVTRATILRLALVRGLDALEDEAERKPKR